MELGARSRVGLVMLVVTAVPAAWGVETALRGLLFGTAEFEELRGVLRPALTGVVRGLVVVTVLALWPTWALMRWLVRRRLRALPGRRPDLRVSVRLMAFLGASSVLQAPGVIATFAGLFVADGRAVAGVVGVGTLGLLGLGWVTLRDCVREGPAGAEKNLDGLPPAP